MRVPAPHPRDARVPRTKRLKLWGGAIALAALLFSALALTQSGGVLAQSPNNVANPPAPCGPGTVAAFMPEPHEITSGHFYLFDAYWEDTTDLESVEGRTGVLHTNTCPPALTTTAKVTEFGQGHRLIYFFDSKTRRGSASGTPTYTLSHDSHFVDVVTLSVEYSVVDGDPDSATGGALTAEPVTVTWSAPDS